MMICGSLTAAINGVTQRFSFDGPRATHDSGATTEKTTADPSREKAFLSAPPPSVLSSFHAGLSHAAVLLFEILLDCREHKAWSPEVPVSLGKYFLTLFRPIISPNAP